MFFSLPPLFALHKIFCPGKKQGTRGFVCFLKSLPTASFCALPLCSVILREGEWMASNAGGICAAFTSRPRSCWEFLEGEGEISFLSLLSLFTGWKKKSVF